MLWFIIVFSFPFKKKKKGLQNIKLAAFILIMCFSNKNHGVPNFYHIIPTLPLPLPHTYIFQDIKNLKIHNFIALLIWFFFFFLFDFVYFSWSWEIYRSSWIHLAWKRYRRSTISVTHCFIWWFLGGLGKWFYYTILMKV